MDWALKEGYECGYGVYLKPGKTEFSPSNCFVQLKSDFFKINNSKNITYKNKTQSITDWAKELGCSISCLSRRLKIYKDYPIDKIMNLNWNKPRKQFYGTEHLEENIVKLYQEGKTFLEIGKELGCSSGPIGRFLKKNNIKARPAKCRSAL